MLRAVTSLALGLMLIAFCKSENHTSTSPSAMSLLYKTIVSCADGNTFSCLRKRTVLLLDRASNLDKLSLWGDTLVLVKSSPENTTNEDYGTDRSIVESFTNFLDSHRVQLRLPRLSYFLPLSEVTGRGKKNKGYGLLAMTITGAMLAMGMAGLAAMAGKALAASMAALMMAAMAALKKGGGGGGHGGHSSYEVISIPSHHHHRSFLEEQQMNSPYRYDTESHVHHDSR
ncbi:hypothetical protein GE061_014611 [Apolygus lucorum]|uniref:Uncharacterized protein n=1 Tax=Apolygus lucorum TaxID=248454 RepID=A0A8S9XJV4_APOLU|nr:hypothetical protein GE061_014611 [Apolygus lucorum]